MGNRLNDAARPPATSKGCRCTPSARQPLDNEMLVRRLLTPVQHHEIRAWISDARSRLQMPAGLWRSLELASVLMCVDADLSLPPCFDA